MVFFSFWFYLSIVLGIDGEESCGVNLGLVIFSFRRNGVVKVWIYRNVFLFFIVGLFFIFYVF